jgi:type VI secretion system protein ImpH
VRLLPALDLSFGDREVAAIEVDEEAGRFTITSRFFGLYGTSSPLPANYTEQLLYEDPDGRLRAFLDVFNHRLLSLHYRAWQKYRLHVQFDGRGLDAASHRLRILCHVEQPGEPLWLLGFAGLLHQQPLSEAGLEQILSAALDVPITVQSCRVRWTRVPEHQQNALGQRNCTLGGLCALGGEVRAANTFGVHVGPLPYRDFVTFLPNGRRRAAIAALIDRLNADELDCEIDVEIEPDAIEPTWLGEPSQRLGWNTWLGEHAPTRAHRLGAAVSRSLHHPNDPAPNAPMVA